MRAEATTLPGLWRLSAERLHDERGSFERLWCWQALAELGIAFTPVQLSIARNPAAFTLRGLHWQAAPQAETKLVQVLRGRVFDVVVDLRPHSPMFGRWQSFTLDAAAEHGLLVPPGCAHGYLSLEPDSALLYAMDCNHTPAAARGLRWDCPALAIPWPAEPSIVSARDRAWPGFTAWAAEPADTTAAP